MTKRSTWLLFSLNWRKISAAQMAHSYEWLDRALSLHPESIKDNYRKGKLILKELSYYRYAGKEKLHNKDQLKRHGDSHLEKAVAAFEKLTEQERPFCRNEYVKALFNLGKHYLDTIRFDWKEYILRQLAGASQSFL